MSHYTDDDHWIVQCDRPGCITSVEAPRPGLTYPNKRASRLLAESQGWQIAEGDIDIDLCSKHVDETRPVRVTRLYDESGKPVRTVETRARGARGTVPP